jgi:hypothetical protein
MMTNEKFLSSFYFSTFPQILCGLWGHCLMVRKHILFIHNSVIQFKEENTLREFFFERKTTLFFRPSITIR